MPRGHHDIERDRLAAELREAYEQRDDNWRRLCEANDRTAEAERVLRAIARMDPTEDVYDPEPFQVARDYFASRERPMLAPTPEQKARYLRQQQGPTVDLADVDERCPTCHETEQRYGVVPREVDEMGWCSDPWHDQEDR
jgi:hypothetical protein